MTRTTIRPTYLALALALLGSASAAHAADPSPSAASPASPASPSGRPTALVAIDSTRFTTVIEKLQTTEEDFHFDLPTFPYDKGTWAVACLTPCRTPLDLGGIYRVKAFNDVSASAEFTLPLELHAIHVQARSLTTSRIARIVTFVGSVVAISAVSAAAASDTSTGRATGIAIAGGGAAAAVVGAVLWALSPSRVTFE